VQDNHPHTLDLAFARIDPGKNVRLRYPHEKVISSGNVNNS